MGKFIIAILLYVFGFLTIAAGSWFFLILGIWEVVEMIQTGTVTLGGLLWAGFLIFIREAIAVVIGVGMFIGAAALMATADW